MGASDNAIMQKMLESLLALSPLDGRYRAETEALRSAFSEFAYLRQRAQVEAAYLAALSCDLHLVRDLAPGEVDFLLSLGERFSPQDAEAIREIERTTRHDVKAIEIFLRSRLAETSLADTVSWLHFGLTSEDVNNIAQALALRAARDQVLLPALAEVRARLAWLTDQYKSAPMLARTHGQPAVPTTFGKEMAVFLSRLHREMSALQEHPFEAKLSGAVGNFNALALSFPQVDWLAFSERFLKGLGLKANPVTTQILPYENWLEFFDILRRIHAILLGLSQDLWRYVSGNYLRLRLVATEVGSSTMPQKVNPMDFENAEGNLGLANALLEHYGRKLPISRLQRDLSDSTVRRTFGAALGHALVGYNSLARGLERIELDEAALRIELEAHWEVIAEGVQTLLRTVARPDAYDLLKSLTRGKGLSRERYLQWVDELEIESGIKDRLRSLTPLSYLGLAEKIAEQVLENMDIDWRQDDRHDYHRNAVG